MLNDSFSERLNYVLDQEGFPPKNRGRIQLLAELFDLSHRGASKWVNGESCPPAKKFADIAKKLNVNETWLKTGRGFMRESLYAEEPHFALFARQPQDVPIYSNSHFMTENKCLLKTICCYLPYSGNFFGIILESDAMAPRFPRNSILIFNQNKPIADGDFVLVDHPSYPEPLFRQILILNYACYLLAENPKFERLTLSSGEKIIGRLVQVIYSLDIEPKYIHPSTDTIMP